jgi:hypothetical protein
VRDLGREVVALDAVGVVEEVERVVDREPESGAPGDEPLVELGRDADLGDLVEDLRGDGEQADERRAGAWPQHHLEAALQREDLGVEARARDHVGQQVLDVVEDAGLGHGVREVEDLLLEQELLFVVEHRRIVAPGRGRSRAPCRHSETSRRATRRGRNTRRRTLAGPALTPVQEVLHGPAAATQAAGRRSLERRHAR